MLAIGIIGTHLFSPDDLEKVKEVQAGYKAALLLAYEGTTWPCRSKHGPNRDVQQSLISLANVPSLSR